MRTSGVSADWRQRASIEELHNEVVQPDVVHLADVRVIERRDGSRFPLEAGAEFGVRLLDRHQAIQTRVPRLVHLPHPAGADQREDLVRAEPRAGLQGHDSGILLLGAAPRRPLREFRNEVCTGDGGADLIEDHVASEPQDFVALQVRIQLPVRLIGQTDDDGEPF